ncbi:hypothetical protein ACQR1V_02615 [Bradyrhizobium oligotrophicum]|uniref:hypothetical protein n=1 Tax=Bradyrhizobium oligotrophicum TaxID=44255 RepID=UPI003EB9EFDE
MIITYTGSAGELETTDIADIEIHRNVAANGTNPVAATAIPATCARTVAIVTTSTGNVSVFLAGGQVGAVIEVYAVSGPVTVYAGTTISVGDPLVPFLNGATTVIVTSGARFKSVSGKWAHLS